MQAFKQQQHMTLEQNNQSPHLLSGHRVDDEVTEPLTSQGKMQFTKEEKMELEFTEQATVNPAFEGTDGDEQPPLTVDLEERHTEALDETVHKGVDLLYSLNDRPPWYLCILLGFQHYILAFGGIIAVPLILAEPLCIKDNNTAKSQLICTIFFVSGICTILQTSVGTRLPILQGGTFSFITPTLAILALPKWQCPASKAPLTLSVQLQNSTSPQHTENPDEVWMSRMREIQGAILLSSLLQVILGFSGLVGLVLKFIGPLAIAPTINLIGLSLFSEAGKKSGGHWGIAALTVCLILLFSQYLSKVNVPMVAYKDKKWKVFHYPLFKLFSALFGMCGGWLVCFLLTVFDILPSKSDEYGFSARTDINLDAVTNSPWFHVPYPGQWGHPTVSLSSVLGMMAGVLASTMESIGDYYACARLSGAPPPPTHAINRGIAVEGIGCILAALWGTGNGTTSYSQNIAALGITKVGSRLVLQTAGVIMIILGIFGKFGAVFITIPDPVIGGMFLVMFGMIAAVGISNLQDNGLKSQNRFRRRDARKRKLGTRLVWCRETDLALRSDTGPTGYVDLNSSRNLLILGFSTFSGLVLPAWFHSNPGIIDTDKALLPPSFFLSVDTQLRARQKTKPGRHPRHQWRFVETLSNRRTYVDTGIWTATGGSDGIKELDQVIVVLFTTHMFIGGFFGFVLDNTIPGTRKERGIESWQDKVREESKSTYDQSSYDIPFCNGALKRFKCFRYLPFLPSYKMTQPETSRCVGEEKCPVTFVFRHIVVLPLRIPLHVNSTNFCRHLACPGSAWGSWSRMEPGMSDHVLCGQQRIHQLQ
ncbi:hypothetical protein Q8A73_023198 [Channa argus]|nr:hypothetical protein Q8A73_023198 [Channa argus]